MKIMVFTEGTIIMHRGGIGYAREEISRQVVEKEKSIYDWPSYVPIGNAVKKLKTWKNQGAEILYLTSRTRPNEVESIRRVLKKHDFPVGQLLFRQKDQQYSDIAESIVPDVLVEDDCKSIGGADEMTITHVRPEIRGRIKSTSVKEFQGIDHLPDEISVLVELRNL